MSADQRHALPQQAIPQGCTVIEVPDRNNEPHVHKAEFVIIDPDDRSPCEGELFAIQYRSAPAGQHSIVRMDRREGLFGKNGVQSRQFRWFAGETAHRRALNLSGAPTGENAVWADGPYTDAYLEAITLGKIIGIYEPDFRQQLTKVN